MSKLNGTTILVYADGTLIASQKNCTITWEQELPEATSKASTGWEEHINGVRRATVDFDSLYETVGLSAEEFITYITSRASLVLLIDGTGVPIVGEAKVKNISINSPMEEAVTYSGSFKFTGPAWMLTGAYANLLTDPDGTQTDYDTLTVSGIKITSAINAAGDAYCASNTFAVTTGDVFKVIFFHTQTSGQAPTFAIAEFGVGGRSNDVVAVAGVNVMTLTATGSGTLCLYITNTAAANWSTTNIYLFKT